ncbi:MAG: AAA family ATPase [Proteobacteria bacterium]|nr:AAA family ATPase [Pseudomonadota bacterium]
MNLYANLSLEREPFSNSPDPNFLHETRQHATCMQELEISLRLRRGLNVITGDIGTGKTTLCRGLLRTFANDREVDMHLLLDPHFATSEEFLRVILSSVSRLTPDPDMGLWELKEALKQQLYRLGMVERRLVVLIIDEGQKMSPENLELLREMLNYETNSSKLLQIVIFAQRELEPLLEAMPNLVDRINVRKRLRALTLPETRQMIRHRLKVAASAEALPRVDFSEVAICAIHMASGGSPRKIVRLCHMSMLEMLVRGKTSVGIVEVRAATRPDAPARRPHRRALAAAVAVMLCLGLGSLWYSAGPAGPVLGPGLAQRGLDAQPQATAPGDVANITASTAAGSVSSTVDNSAQAEAKTASGAAAGGESRSAGLAAEGLTLLPENGETQSAPAGLTLLPHRDQGPSLRSPIARGSEAQVVPARLHVATPGQGGLRTVVALADEGAKDEPHGLFRSASFSSASFSMVGSQ